MLRYRERRVAAVAGKKRQHVLCAALAGLLLAAACSPKATAEGRRELDALQEERILKFHAPGTKLKSKTDQAASEPDWAGVSQQTRVSRTFSMAGLPGATVAAYRDRALEEGWHLFRIDCSRHGRQTETGFFKDLKSFVAYLDVSAVLPNGGYQVEPGLTVGLHTGNRPPPPSRLRPGTLRGDVNCLSRLDAGDPSMHRFTPPATPRDLCATLTLTEAASVVPGVTVAAPADGGCLYKDGLGQQYFGVSNAWEARSLYEATQFSALGMERGVLLQGDWDLSGAWVDLPSGPVMLFASPGFLVEDQLLMLAQFIQS